MIGGQIVWYIGDAETFVPVLNARFASRAEAEYVRRIMPVEHPHKGLKVFASEGWPGSPGQARLLGLDHIALPRPQR